MNFDFIVLVGVERENGSVVLRWDLVEESSGGAVVRATVDEQALSVLLRASDSEKLGVFCDLRDFEQEVSATLFSVRIAIQKVLSSLCGTRVVGRKNWEVVQPLVCVSPYDKIEYARLEKVLKPSATSPRSESD